MDIIKSLTSELSTCLNSCANRLRECDYSEFPLKKANHRISIILYKLRELADRASDLYNNTINTNDDHKNFLTIITSMTTIMITNSKSLLILVQAALSKNQKNERVITYPDYRVIIGLIKSLEQLMIPINEARLKLDESERRRDRSTRSNHHTPPRADRVPVRSSTRTSNTSTHENIKADKYKPSHIGHGKWNRIISEIDSCLAGRPNYAVREINREIKSEDNLNLNCTLVRSLLEYLNKLNETRDCRNVLKLREEIQQINESIRSVPRPYDDDEEDDEE